MLRVVLAVLLAGAAVGAGAEGLGRSEQLWKSYLAETVRRGIPLLATSSPEVVPFWPAVDKARANAQSLDPGPDTDLVSAWVGFYEGDPSAALKALESRWPRPGVVLFSPRQWAEALFARWSPDADPRAWTNAWLAWEDKAYSPRTLVRGLTVFEKSDPSAVAPLLVQARRLYPEDRRLFALAAAHPDVVPQAQALVTRDLKTGGWSDDALASFLDAHPDARTLLVAAGYPAARLEALSARDYGAWAAQKSPAPLADGPWTWDADLDGRVESRLVFAAGKPVTWTRTATDGGVWTLGFTNGLPDTVTEGFDGTTWTLKYEDYPLAASLSYRWGSSTLVYRFPPLEVAVPLWPADRFRGDPARLPALMAEQWLPLDARALAQKTASIETWVAGVRTQDVLVYQGQTWLLVEDTNHDGVDDRWSYFRSGRLSSVYSDLEGRGQATLRELYAQGELAQVQSRLPQGNRNEFVLFPNEGVQLWDPHGQARPLDRIFQWDGARLDALVFTGSTLPWETMPSWEPRP